MAPRVRPLEERLWRHVEKTDDCWLWTGALRGNGYGAIWVGNRKTGGHRPAHRVVWELTNAPIPVGMFVLHRCDVRRCVRPDHLFLGDHRANMADMAAKQRTPRGARHWQNVKPWRSARGERNGNSRLTRSQALAIRSRYAAGGVSLMTLANEYAVSKKTVLNIVHKRIWL